jgi:hypothetical protein
MVKLQVNHKDIILLLLVNKTLSLTPFLKLGLFERTEFVQDNAESGRRIWH